MQHNWKRDCRSFLGNYACDMVKYNDVESCEACDFYEQYTKKVLIIKLGASGDVLRTTSLLPAIKAKYGNPMISWLTTDYNKAIIENNPLVDKIFVYDTDTVLRLQQEKFDVLFSLETTTPGTLLANLVRADEKYGWYFHEDGHPSSFNQAADHYLETQFSDKLNMENRKTYQEMMFEAVELPYNKQDYILKLSEKDLAYAKNFFSLYGVKDDDFVVAINPAAGSRWRSKNWSKERVVEFVRRLRRESDFKVIILGGPEEVDLMSFFMNQFNKENISVIFNNYNNTLGEFMGVVNRCNVVIATDSLALHIAAALKKNTIALFFATPPWEIEDYGRIKKFVSPLFDKYFFTDDYVEELASSIQPNDVLLAIKDYLAQQ